MATCTATPSILMKLSAIVGYCPDIAKRMKNAPGVYGVHDEFDQIIKGLTRLGFEPRWAKVCGSSRNPSVEGFPVLIDDGGYHTRAHGHLQHYYATNSDVGDTFDIEGVQYVLVYLDQYHGCCYTPGHQWCIAVEANKVRLNA